MEYGDPLTVTGAGFKPALAPEPERQDSGPAGREFFALGPPAGGVLRTPPGNRLASMPHTQHRYASGLATQGGQLPRQARFGPAWGAFVGW